MKTFNAIILLFTAAVSAPAGILVGPIANPSNGHEYYLITPNTWAGAEAEAESLGGTLAVINDAAEQEWIFSKFGSYEGGRDSWIGLRRSYSGGPFAWVTGEELTYSNWNPGQPDNAGGNESCAHLWINNGMKGTWNDLVETSQLLGVVEVPGKSGASLTEKEKSLIGAWYYNGQADQRCWIAGTGNALFVINERQDASRVAFTADGFLFAPKWRVHAEILKDRILWSNGTWWSRKPVSYSGMKIGKEDTDRDDR